MESKPHRDIDLCDTAYHQAQTFSVFFLHNGLIVAFPDVLSVDVAIFGKFRSARDVVYYSRGWSGCAVIFIFVSGE